MQRLSQIAGWVFGVVMIGLSFFVAADVLSRKFFAMSFEGADELGGYALAVGAGLSFVVALAQQAHMRIDLLSARLPLTARAALDWLSVLSLTALAGLLMFLGAQMLRQSVEYSSTAPTPWATPLVWPQTVWLAALALFALAALAGLITATRFLLSGRFDLLAARFGGGGEDEALQAELDDVRRRS